MCVTAVQVMYVDVTESGLVTAELWSLSMAGVIIYGDSMVSLVREITLQTGRMKKPPAWSQTVCLTGWCCLMGSCGLTLCICIARLRVRVRWWVWREALRV